MAYLGNTPTTQSFISGTDYFNGDAATIAFTLSRTVASVNDVEVVINNVVQQPNTAYTISGTTITFTSAPSAGTSNIYVRYLSTTTQSITPSQNTVSYSTLNSDNQSKLGISFKNRIINGAMVIDQRNAGASTTPSGSSGGTYTLDRWVYQASATGKFTVQQNAGSVTPPVGFTKYLGLTVASAVSIGASDYFGIYQAIEGNNVADLGFGTVNAKTVTLSAWVRSSLTGTFGGSIENGNSDRSYPFTYTISSANTWTQISVTVPGDATGTWATDNSVSIYVRFGLGVGSSYSGTAGAWAAGDKESATGAVSVVGTAGATFYITGVQLEVGTQATTFDYRSYGTELALCQRYYWKVLSQSYFFNISYYASNSLYTIVQFPVSMRAAPTTACTSGTNYYVVYANSTTDFLNSVSLEGANVCNTALKNNTEASGTSGSTGTLALNDGAGVIAFTAEL